MALREVGYSFRLSQIRLFDPSGGTKDAYSTQDTTHLSRPPHCPSLEGRGKISTIGFFRISVYPASTADSVQLLHPH